MTATPESPKSVLRRQIRKALAALSREDRASASLRACEHIISSALWRQARTLLLYAPRVDEIDITPLWARALSEAKMLCLPRFDPFTNQYSVSHVVDPTSDLAAGRYGIPEPLPHCPPVSVNRLDFVLVPGLAFDPNGRRLGRGQGHYDRLLAGVEALKCGIGFDVQWLESIPQEPCDVLLDVSLTPGRGLVWSPARI